MIKANELRIGNYVSNPVNDICRVSKLIKYHNVIGITPLTFNTYVFSGCEINPILLTPEILDKCGFVNNPYQDRYELGDIHVEYCGIRNICWIEIAPHIEYLHQLQNYVYANTNKELIFKP